MTRAVRLLKIKKKEFEELSFRAGKESLTDYVARAKALVMKPEQHSVTTSGQDINRRILHGLFSYFDVKKKMFLIIADIKYELRKPWRGSRTKG